MKRNVFIQVRRKRNKTTKLAFLFLLFVVLAGISFFSLFREKEERKEEKVTKSDIHLEQCTCSREYNLPIIMIDLKGQEIPLNTEYVQREINGVEYNIASAQEKILVELSVYEPLEKGYTCTCGAVPPVITSLAYLNIRGQSSVSFPKKQYSIKFVKEDLSQNDVALLGMSAHSKWVLNGSYLDRSCLRNYMAYSLADEVMEYAPDTEFCEVFLKNGKGFVSDYIGIYLAVEKIEKDKNRVDIEEANEEYEDVSFMIARDKIKDQDVVIDTDWSIFDEDYLFTDDGRQKLYAELIHVYPSGNDLTKRYQKRIVDYLNAFEYALYSSDFADKKKGYEKYIDVDSFIYYAMINEITKNIDGATVSTYFYKDVTSKMKAGPVWDFDRSAGNTFVEEVDEVEGIIMDSVPWFQRLFQDDKFSRKYQMYYSLKRETVFSDEAILKKLEDAKNTLGPAITRNEARWYASSLGNYPEEYYNLKMFYLNRLKWLDENNKLMQRDLESKKE